MNSMKMQDIHINTLQGSSFIDVSTDNTLFLFPTLWIWGGCEYLYILRDMHTAITGSVIFKHYNSNYQLHVTVYTVSDCGRWTNSQFKYQNSLTVYKMPYLL